jgi:hypothetical protein
MSDLPVDNAVIINQTKKWITDVVVGCGFCPFASKELKRGSIHYEILQEATTASTLKSFAEMMYLLDKEDGIETALLILPGRFEDFGKFMDVTELADELLFREVYEGIYQLASFHPLYMFDESDENDPANYTNRSPYPMLHLLREKSVSSAVDTFPGIDAIPKRNISFSKEKGMPFMQALLASCMK